MINRSKLPIPDAEIKFHLPEIKQHVYDNGIKVYHVEKNKLPIVQLSFMVNAGSKLDPDGKPGVSHLTAMMIDEGAGPYSSLELDDEIEKLGSALNISNNHDAFFVSMLTLKEHFERSFELTSLILNDPKLSNEDFQREHHKLQNKLQQMYDDPGYIASTIFEKICFDSTKYSIPAAGIRSSVKNILPDDITEFYKKHFFENNITLIVVGNLTEHELDESIQKYFGKSKRESDSSGTSKFARKKQQLYLIDKPGSAQSELRIGHITSERKSEDFFAKLIMNSILGGQFSSRLNLNLRENKGFTYGVNSSFRYNVETGLFQISTAVNLENTADTLREIFKEINGVKDNISEEEINFSKSYLIKSFPSKFETYGQIAGNINMIALHKLEEDYFNNYIQNIHSVTEEEIRNAAINSLIPHEMSIVIVGDKKFLSQQLSKSDFEIIELDFEGNPV